MRSCRIGAATAVVLVLSLTGCGLADSGLEAGPRAPTGLGTGPILYFVDESGDLVAQARESGRLGTPAEAVSLLLTGYAGDATLHTEIHDATVTLTDASVSDDVLTVRLPLGSWETSRTGADQIACTALASHIQGGGSKTSQVILGFTNRSIGPMDCPALIDPSAE